MLLRNAGKLRKKKAYLLAVSLTLGIPEQALDIEFCLDFPDDLWFRILSGNLRPVF
jgi:hypothetical protein